MRIAVPFRKDGRRSRWAEPATRFWTFVTKTPTCWLWQGDHVRRGYGRITFNGIRQGAHRVAWQLANGPIPDNLQVLHRCDVPACVRLDHLFVGTIADNVRDCTRKHRNILIETPMLWARGDQHWTRQERGRTWRQRIATQRREELRSGLRVVIRNERGQIMGHRIIR